MASTQYSIACELLLLVKQMLNEVEGKEKSVTKLVLTGGLCQSLFFREVLGAGIALLGENIVVFQSARQGPLAFQTAAYGALLNGMLGIQEHNAVIEELSPLREFQSQAKPVWRQAIQEKLLSGA